MKKISKRNQLKLNKVNVSKLNMKMTHSILGGDIPDPSKEFTCDLDKCTTSRTTVDFNEDRSIATIC